MSPPSAAAFDHNYVEANRPLVVFTPRGAFQERRGVAIVSSGLPVEALNWGFRRPPFDDVVESAAAVRAACAPASLPHRLVFRGEHRDALRVLGSHDWRHREEGSPAMTLALPVAPPPPPELAIREVRTPAGIAAYGEAAFNGFGFPPRAAGLFLHERLLELSHFRLYAGIVDGALVATSMLVATGAIAGVYWVATRPEHRGRGYGEAITWAAVAGGQAVGCRTAFLVASQAGFPVYARMGFVHAFEHELLHPTA